MKTYSPISSNAIGAAADSWMALMDRLLTLRNGCTKEKEMEHLRENILKLIDIYYEALDAPKQGGKKVSRDCVIIWLLYNTLLNLFNL